MSATAMQVKAYFEISSAKKFRDEWKELSSKEKDYFKTAVGQEVNGS